MRTRRDDARDMTPMLGAQRRDERVVVGGRVDVVERAQRHTCFRKPGLIDIEDIERRKPLRSAPLTTVEIRPDLWQRGPPVRGACRLRASADPRCGRVAGGREVDEET